MLEGILGGKSTDPDDLIRITPLKITRRTTGTAGVVALGGVIAAILNEISSVGLNLSEYAIVVVIASALIAAAIASAGDVLARAYVEAHAKAKAVPPVHVGEYEVVPENGDIRVHHVVGAP